MGYLVEMFIQTDGDFGFTQLSEFKEISMAEDIFVADTENLTSAMRLVNKQIDTIANSIDSSREYVIKDVIDKLREIQEVMSKINKNDEGDELFLKWSCGNQYGYFRIYKHNLIDVIGTYNKINNLLSQIGIYDSSILFKERMI